jgi:alpha-N-arabinofuranosidase
MDGPWQIGHKTALQYGQLAAEAGKAMRLVDPRIELVISGSSNSRMPTFGTWERTALTEAYDAVDHISMHSYYQQHRNDRDSFLAAAVDMDQFIDAIVATADHVRAVGRHAKRLTIAFDEWNVWYQSRFPGEENLPIAEAPPLLEDVYSVTDAVVVGNLLISLLRHADRVKIGCQAQLVNVIAPIMTAAGGPAWQQTIYHPYALTSRYGRGTVLRVEAQSPTHETSAHGEVPLLDAVAVIRDDEGLVLFAVNRDQHEEMAVDIDLRSLPHLVAGEHVAIADADPDAVNDEQNPRRVTPRRLRDPNADGGRLQVLLPPLSWNMIHLTGN